MNDLLEKLKGGDLRSIGRSNEVVRQIGNNQRLFDEIFQGIFDDNPLVRMRSADVIETVSRKHPHFLIKHKTTILKNLGDFQQKEVKWHIALMLPYLELTKTESEIIFKELSKWIIDEESKIVKVNSMQALADISLRASDLKEKTIVLIDKQMETGCPSLVSGGKKLLKKLS